MMDYNYLKLTALFLSLFLLSCDNKPEDRETVKVTGPQQVILYSWKEYTSLNVLKEFEKETGIKVILKEFETSDEQMGALQSDPYFCDLTVIDSHIAASQFIQMKLISKLDTSKLKNLDLYEEHFHNFKEVGIPYSFGITGYAVDSRHIKEDFKDYTFLLNPLYKNRISMLEDPFDCFLSLMVLTNNNINRTIDEKVIAELEQTSEKIRLNEVTFNETFTNLDLLVDEKKWIVQTYSGDAAGYQKENPFIKFYFPEKAYNAWSEIICLTTNSPNKENAYKLLNYLSEAKNAAAFSNEFYYANGIIGSHQFMDEESRKNPLINVEENIRKNGVFYLKSKESNSVMQRIYSLLSTSDNKVNDSDEKEN